ncbi:hypothetical protein [Methylobacterium sp. A54F]
MSDPGAPSGAGAPPSFGVEMGAHAPRIRITIGARAIPVEIEPAQAAELGVALLAASALCAPGNPRPPEGSAIRDAHLPVVQWQTGILNATGLPVLLPTLLGGAQLVLTFPPEQAAACAQALQAAATTPRPA